ncbi:SdpA family antimicrobial peptide system protein [Sphingobacterium sp. Mn56C]|uniref:SdpA family antimicrobial peptide system protein n=1 Tax=Sphingobacterium sp. Mn56C TaxID=3395261 RepID=UPI003BC53346
MVYIKYIIALSWIIFGFAVFSASRNEQVILNSQMKTYLNQMFPEGWGFFTKNPREASMSVYEYKEGKLIEIPFLNQSIATYFGLSRKRRIIAYEASMVAGTIGKKNWIENKSKSLEDYKDCVPIKKKLNSDYSHITCGTYFVKLFNPVPFAWAKEGQGDNNPFTFVKVLIK